MGRASRFSLPLDLMFWFFSTRQAQAPSAFSLQSVQSAVPLQVLSLGKSSTDWDTRSWWFQTHWFLWSSVSSTDLPTGFFLRMLLSSSAVQTTFLIRWFLWHRWQAMSTFRTFQIQRKRCVQQSAREFPSTISLQSSLPCLADGSGRFLVSRHCLHFLQSLEFSTASMLPRSRCQRKFRYRTVILWST